MINSGLLWGALNARVKTVFNLVVTGKTFDILQQGDDMIKDRL